MESDRRTFVSLLTLGATAAALRSKAAESTEPSTDILSDKQWEEIDASTERSLAWLAKQQQRDGSFATLPLAQPGVTALCVLTYLSYGHTPGSEPYGKVIENGINYIVNCQKENGLLALIAPGGPTITRNVSRTIGATVTYNHGISSVALAEAYASTKDTTAKEIKTAIEKALEATLTMQRWPKAREVDRGGWRYIDLLYTDGEPVDSNLSNTVWQLFFLRSAKNAGFDVPQQSLDDAVGFVKNCFQPEYGTFVLMPSHQDHRTRGMSGAGVMSLAMAGLHDSKEATAAGDWILKNGFEKYNVVEPFGQVGWYDDRYHYGVFWCTQAAYQLGGRYWETFFPPVVKVLLENQNEDGSWDAESHSSDNKWGNTHTTAMVLLALGAPNQFLPVLQR